MKKNIYSLTIIIVSYISVLAAQNNNYSFFVAGHTYGIPMVNNIGLHPPFKNKFSYIQNRSEIKFGFLTGDIVEHPSIAAWDSVDSDINTLGLPTYFVAGNHDVIDRPLFTSRYGNSYYHFTHENDLFIILDPNLDSWNISGAQWNYLDSLLLNTAQVVDNIYIFFHQVLWHDSTHYSSIVPNSLSGRADTINFWSEVEPLFNNLNNHVFMFAGDFYAWHAKTDVMYDNYDNITLIGSGMGGGPNDNFIVVNIDSSKNVTYDLICLTGNNSNCLGNLSDHQILVNNTEKHNTLNKITIYPNPSNNYININRTHELNNVLIRIYNLQGRLIKEEYHESFLQSGINITSLNSGVYYLQILLNTKIKTIKFVKI